MMNKIENYILVPVTWDDVQQYENCRRKREKLQKAQAKEWKQNQKKMGLIAGCFDKFTINTNNTLTMESSEIDTASYISG